MQRLVDSLQAKTGNALTRLINNKNALAALERDLEARNARMKAILGGGPAKDQTQFQALIKELKQAKGPREKDYGFASLVNWIKENNRRGKFDPILADIESDEIGNTF